VAENGRSELFSCLMPCHFL